MNSSKLTNTDWLNLLCLLFSYYLPQSMHFLVSDGGLSQVQNWLPECGNENLKVKAINTSVDHQWRYRIPSEREGLCHRRVLSLTSDFLYGGLGFVSLPSCVISFFSLWLLMNYIQSDSNVDLIPWTCFRDSYLSSEYGFHKIFLLLRWVTSHSLCLPHLFINGLLCSSGH